jgi:ABC-type nitrate/sulfonate/bicarbonate transport system substrate-binding protein
LGSAPARAQTTLRVGFNGFFGAAPLYLAHDAGIFRKQNINLEMIFIAGGSISTQALVGKSLDILLTGGPPFLNAYLRGAKIKIVAGVTNILPYVVIAVPSITSAEQLRGKKIGISRFGSNTDFVIKIALANFGLSPADVSVLQVGGSGARLAALRSGAIQATVLTPEEALAAQKLGLIPLLDFIAKAIEFPHVSVVAREDTLQGQAALLRRFLAGYLEAIRYFKTNRAEATRKMMALTKSNDGESADKAFESYRRSLPDDGRPTVRGLEALIADFARDDPKAKGLTVAQIADLTFLP